MADATTHAPPQAGGDRNAARAEQLARGAQPAPARGRHARHRPAAGAGRGGLGQDPRAHAPHRPSGGDRGREALGDPRDHVHQQGRPGDARSRRAAGRTHGARDVGDDVPLRLCPHPAHGGGAARLHEALLDLRRRRLGAARAALPRRAVGRPEAVRTARDQVPDLAREEPARGRGRIPASASAPSSSRPPPTCTSSTRSASTR